MGDGDQKAAERVVSRIRKRRLIVPVALALATASLAVSVVSSQVGCGDDDGPSGVDAAPDTPLL